MIDFNPIKKIGIKIGKITKLLIFLLKSILSKCPEILNFLQKVIDQIHPESDTGIPISNPKINTNPISAPKIDADAKGPGVGGTNTWVAYRPVANETAKTVIEVPIFLLNDWQIGDKIINPESQNTGIDTKKPVIFIARLVLFCPIVFKIRLEI